MDTRLMELLVCPLCKGPLTHDPTRAELVCAADRLAYPIRDGIAIMLEGEARALDANGDDASTAGEAPQGTSPQPLA